MHALSGNPSDIRSIHAVMQAMETRVCVAISSSVGSYARGSSVSAGDADELDER